MIQDTPLRKKVFLLISLLAIFLTTACNNDTNNNDFIIEDVVLTDVKYITKADVLSDDLNPKILTMSGLEQVSPVPFVEPFIDDTDDDISTKLLVYDDEAVDLLSSERLLSEEAITFIDGLSKPREGLILEEDGAVTVYYYRQTDERWSKSYYGGTDTMGKYACGPTAMSVVVSSLSDSIIDPVQMAEWAYDNGYWYPKSGSLHSLIPDAAKFFGLDVVGIPNDDKSEKKIKEALLEGELIVALMGKGHFTNGGHFIILRGIDSDGKVIVADPASINRTNQRWDLSLIVGEARAWADANGPFWIISR